MKNIIYIIGIMFLIVGCSRESKVLFDTMPNTYLTKSTFASLPHWEEENYDKSLVSFVNNCRSKKAKKLYLSLCEKAKTVSDAKDFFQENFTPYLLSSQDDNSIGLLTGYYEPTLRGARVKSERYKYPLYKTPKDLMIVDLSSIYPELKNYRLRGRVEGNKVVPYDTREESVDNDVNATVICYTDSKIDNFFLEIQGSGRVILDDNSSLFIGYDNQNGHKYRAIGRYLVQIKALELKDVSLQSIRAWLEKNPSRVDEVLNYNQSMVYFAKRDQGATGALGLELEAERSIAVDRNFIPLGSMLYLNSQTDTKKIDKIVFAQDTGGAIKGTVRADLFLGDTEQALEVAGRLKSPLKLWLLLPKNKI